MRKHGYRISKLAEFYPEMEPNLLGLNTSFPGSSSLPIIQLRLRHPTNPSRFLEYEQVVQTMLHELTHCRHGPHDDKFWKLFKSLQEELNTLRFSGYTGEGFLGRGEQLGSVPKGLSAHEAKKRAREAAERRRKGDQGRGRILGSGTLGPIRWLIEDVPGGHSFLKPKDGKRSAGGSRGGSVPNRTNSAPPLSPYATPQQVAAEAALKRNKDGKKVAVPGPRQGPPITEETGVCSGVRLSTLEQVDKEIALMNGFESIAHMESANERAIMQAAIELLEEADKEEEILKQKERDERNITAGPSNHSIPITTSRRPPAPPQQQRAPPPVIDLTEEDLYARPINRTQSAPIVPRHTHPTHPVTAAPVMSQGWDCPVCTFKNDDNHLQCSLCRVERNSKHMDDNETKAQIVAMKNFEDRQKEMARGARSLGGTAHAGQPGTKGKAVDRGFGGSSVPQRKPTIINDTWTCHGCGWVVRTEWWSCGNCGTVKLQS